MFSRYARAVPTVPVYRSSYRRRRGLPYRVKKQLRRFRRSRYADRGLRKIAEKAFPRGSKESISFWGEDWTKANDLQKALRRATNFRGKGDYTVSSGPLVANQLVSGSGQAPVMVNTSSDLTGDVYICHREFVANVKAQVPISGSGGSTFYNTSYPVNAAMSVSFPWLSQLAQNFTMYEFEGLVYEYRPTSGEFGTSGSNALGKVILATQYDPDAADFTNSVTMENYDYANASKPSEHMVHGVETANQQRAPNMLYTRTGTSTKDKIFTDLGTFQVATEGVQVNNLTPGSLVNVGELWVAYKVKLSRAQLYETLAYGLKCDAFVFPSDGTSMTSSQSIVSELGNMGGYVTSDDSNALNYYFPTTVNSGYFIATLFCIQPAATIRKLQDMQIPTDNPYIQFGKFALVNNVALAPAQYISANSLGSTGVISGSVQIAPNNLTAATSNTTISCVCVFKLTAPGNARGAIRFRWDGSMAANCITQLIVQEIQPSLFSF